MCVWGGGGGERGGAGRDAPRGDRHVSNGSENGVAANREVCMAGNGSAVWQWRWLTSLRARLRRRALIMMPVRVHEASSGTSTSIRGIEEPSGVQKPRGSRIRARF